MRQYGVFGRKSHETNVSAFTDSWPTLGLVHPPKVEVFDVAAMTNTDPKGVVRPVDEYRLEPFGLYLARPSPGRTQFHYIESWLLPALGLRVTDFWFTPGHELDQDFYLDVVQIDVGADQWRTRDLYLDIVLRAGKDQAVVDSDDLMAAVSSGLVTEADAVTAVETAYVTVDDLARNGYDLARWLATRDITLTWRRR